MNITPSSLPRLRHCLGGHALPSATEQQPSMSRGTALHSYLEVLTNGATREAALEAVAPEWRADAEAIDLESLPPLASASAEVALAWDMATDECRVLGVGFTRAQAKAACQPGEMPMLLDRVGTTSPTSGFVGDWKTGWAEDLGPASEHWQVLTYGAVALLAYGWNEVTVALCRVDMNPPRWDSVRLDWLKATAHLAAVRDLLQRAEVAQRAYSERREVPPLSLGVWCEWCPAKRQCPAKVGAALALVNGDAAAALKSGVELAPEEAGRLWWQLTEHVLPMLEQMRKDLEGIAKSESLPLPNGGALTLVEEGEDKVVAAVAGAWIERHLGPEVTAEAVVSKPSCSWTSLEAAVRKHYMPKLLGEWEAAGKKGRKPALTRVMAEIRAEMLNVQVAKRATWQAVRPVKALPG